MSTLEAQATMIQTGKRTLAEDYVKQDVKTHESSYSSFVTLVKWSSVACFIITMLVIFAIAD